MNVFAKLNHVAINSNEFALLGRFYQALFGMTPFSGAPAAASAVAVRDGHVGLNINARRPGRPSGLDHFGFEVEDIEVVYDRMRRKYPDCDWVKRPAARPYAGTSAHDPDGNIFDLSHRSLKNRGDVYVQDDEKHDRFINRFAIRTLHPERCAEFYGDVFELQPTNEKGVDGACYMSDGRVTLALMPWDIGDYLDTGVSRAGPEHLGFKVESIATFKTDAEGLGKRSFLMRTWPIDTDGDMQARMTMLKRSHPNQQFWMSDFDGVLLSVSE
jgi:catechol 2,3-dioxygenase-like lactoylglutathione lyase family enzyme